MGLCDDEWRFTTPRRKHDYPPDKREKDTLTVLKQADLLCAAVAA